MKKYLIICGCSCVLEIASTLYITTISDKSPLMMLMAFLGPLLNLPFGGYMVETKTWEERIKLALALGFGYLWGAAIVYFATII
jgi:hypothetical protein